MQFNNNNNHCHEIGHLVRNCPKKLTEKKKDDEDASVAVLTGQFDDVRVLNTEVDCVTRVLWCDKHGWCNQRGLRSRHRGDRLSGW